MSLEAWQNTWLALMLAPEQRETILAVCPPGLNEEEYRALCQTPQARLESIAGAVQRGRKSVLASSLPLSLRRYLPRELISELAESYAYTFPAAVVFPPAQGMARWLNWLGSKIDSKQFPHLQDLIDYEILLTQLRFFMKPVPAIASLGVCLSPRVGLVVAGPELDTLIQALAQGQEYQNLENSPRQGWLVSLWGQEISRQPLHWSIFELLSHLDGQLTWAQALDLTLSNNPELVTQKSALFAWETWFLEQGFLV
jgi:hypothetical protein